MLGARRLLCHAVFTPGHPGWQEGIDRAISEYKPDAWKGYTVGDPSRFSRFPFRLDDEKLVYPAYEKFLKAGIRNVCIHKGLMPFSFLEKFGNWRYGKVDDLPKAARDWPDINFIIYHAAFSPLLLIPRGFLESFEKSGRIEWVTDLAEVPQKHGVKNVYADIGTTFAVTAVMHPRLAAGVLGTLVKGLGEDHVLWGTDSVWYGSPQWQIEALRRIEIPPDLQEKHGFSPLGGADSEVKEKVLGRNGAKLYGLNPESVEYRQGAKLADFKEP
jgi:predicted TIM-barrel fold metal-dependent hydrolase